ncbi:MAG: hypothetical protein M3320_03180, partial [Actinomycetota bacterium]|nr:hypothetical protein [Actinomycetota bacterium]
MLDLDNLDPQPLRSFHDSVSGRGPAARAFAMLDRVDGATRTAFRDQSGAASRAAAMEARRSRQLALGSDRALGGFVRGGRVDPTARIFGDINGIVGEAARATRWAAGAHETKRQLGLMRGVVDLAAQQLLDEARSAARLGVAPHRARVLETQLRTAARTASLSTGVRTQLQSALKEIQLAGRWGTTGMSGLE